MPALGTGPAPKPDEQRRRRNPTAPTTKLPAQGRRGEAPDWPLPASIKLTAMRDVLRDDVEDLVSQIDAAPDSADVKPMLKRLERLRERLVVLDRRIEAESENEVALWAELWSTPQAAAWDRLGWTREVAQYVRWKAQAELGDLEASKEARQLADRLGLTPLSMLRLRWEIAPDEMAEKRAEREPTKATPRRRRLMAVDATQAVAVHPPAARKRAPAKKAARQRARPRKSR